MPALQCTFPGCVRTFRSQKGRTYHFRTFHKNNNLLEEIDIQANVALAGHEPMHDGDEDFGMLDDDDATGRQPVPLAPENNEVREGPTITKHPYLSGEC